MRNTFRKYILSILVIFGLVVSPVFAASTTVLGGVEIGIATDKDEYSADETIEVTFVVKNASKESFKDVYAEVDVPEGFVIESKDTYSTKLANFNPNDQIKLSPKYTIDKDKLVAENTNKSSIGAGKANGSKSKATANKNEASPSQVQTTTLTSTQPPVQTTITPVQNPAPATVVTNPAVVTNPNSVTNTATSSNVAPAGNVKTGIGSILPVVIILIIALGIYAISKKKKSTALILLLALATGVAGMGEAYAKATSKENNSFAVEKTIKIDGAEYTIKGKFKINNTYDGAKNKPSEEESSANPTNPNKQSKIKDTDLKEFKSFDQTLLQGFDTRVIFTASYPRATTISVYDSADKLVGTMNDKGDDGDAVAGDGIYTLDTYVKYGKGSHSFYAATEKGVSDSFELDFVDEPTEEMRAVIDDLHAFMVKVSKTYVKEDGEIDLAFNKLALDEVEQKVKELHDAKLIDDYGRTETSITVQTKLGNTIVYAPILEGTKAGVGDVNVNVLTLQPYEDLHGLAIDNGLRDDPRFKIPSGVDTGDKLLRHSAEVMAEKFAGIRYNKDQSISMKEVSVDSIRRFSDNQIILWSGHGIDGYKDGLNRYSAILTGNTVPVGDVKKVGEDFKNNRLVYVFNDDDRTTYHLAFTYKFIEDNISSMKNSYIFLGTCFSAKDKRLAEAFINKGASAVIGNSNRVVARYDDSIAFFVNRLMVEVNPNTGKLYTIREALTEAKRKLGANDKEYKVLDPEYKHLPASEHLIYGNGDYRITDGLATSDAQILPQPSPEPAPLPLPLPVPRPNNDQTPTEKEMEVRGIALSAGDQRSTIANSRVDFSQNGEIKASFTTSSAGTFTGKLKAGTYDVTVTATGYMDLKSTETIYLNQDKNIEPFLMVPTSATGTYNLTGRIINADTNNGENAVTLRVRPGRNNFTSTTVAETTTQAMDGLAGSYSLSLAPGYYTLESLKGGFITKYFNIHIAKDTTKYEYISVSPITNMNRAILSGYFAPSDFTIHVEGYNSETDRKIDAVETDSRYQDIDGEIYFPRPILTDRTFNRKIAQIRPNSTSTYYLGIETDLDLSLDAANTKVDLYMGPYFIESYYPNPITAGRYHNVFATNGENIVSIARPSAEEFMTSYFRTN